MLEDKSAYRQIIRTTTIFGGVQIIQIIIGIVRSKIIAVLLGPAGIGLMGLFQAGTGLISGLTNFGLSTSAIKSISLAQAEDDDKKVGRIIAVFRRLVWATGLLGLLLTLGLSSYLSQITFGNKGYTWAFALLSIIVLINQISTGQEVLLRAMRQVKLMAKSSVIGSICGLLISLPFYYFYGMEGIVPALIIAAFTSLFFTWFFASKLSLNIVQVDFSTVKLEGKEMLKMGFMISFSGVITLVFSYLVRIFISNYGSVTDVGLYNAGFTIVNTYVGMIFTAMATDYYPKLSGVSNDVQKSNMAINQQAEISILILSPIIMIFIVFIKWVVFLFYSEAFLPINLMILFAVTGTLFKALSWAISFLLLAKSTGKLFFWNELIASIYMLAGNLAGYYYFGLTGLGLSYLFSYALYALQVFFISKKLFGFEMNNEFKIVFIINSFLMIMCLLIALTVEDGWLMYSSGIFLILASLWFNIYHLEKRLVFGTRLLRFWK
jgi:O-antigen/teichoic acid export membrane protein